MTGNEQDTTITDSTPNSNGPDGAAGGMGVSSERVGPTGPDQFGTDGTRDVGPSDSTPDAPPEQSRGGAEPKPDEPTPTRAGYPSADPRSAEHPYDAPPAV